MDRARAVVCMKNAIPATVSSHRVLVGGREEGGDMVVVVVVVVVVGEVVWGDMGEEEV